MALEVLFLRLQDFALLCLNKGWKWSALLGKLGEQLDSRFFSLALRKFKWRVSDRDGWNGKNIGQRTLSPRVLSKAAVSTGLYHVSLSTKKLRALPPSSALVFFSQRRHSWQRSVGIWEQHPAASVQNIHVWPRQNKVKQGLKPEQEFSKRVERASSLEAKHT